MWQTRFFDFCIETLCKSDMLKACHPNFSVKESAYIQLMLRVSFHAPKRMLWSIHIETVCLFFVSTYLEKDGNLMQHLESIA